MKYLPADVKRIRTALGLDQEKFGQKLAVSREMVSKMENGLKAISKSTALLLEQMDGELSSQNIVQGKDKEVVALGKHVPLRLKPDEFAEAFGNWEGLPIYNKPITASFINTYNDETINQPMYYLHDPRFRDCQFGAIITGDSMHSEIRHGDIAMCREITDKSFIVFGDIYYIVAKNGLETCKYINAGKDENSLLLVPRNENISPSPIKKNMIDRLYKVRGIIRGY